MNGSRIPSLFQDRNLTQTEVAAMMGWTSQELLEVIHGNQDLRLSELQKLAKIFGTTVSYLIGEDGAIRHRGEWQNIKRDIRLINSRMMRLSFTSGVQTVEVSFPIETPPEIWKPIIDEAATKVFRDETKNQQTEKMTTKEGEVDP